MFEVRNVITRKVIVEIRGYQKALDFAKRMALSTGKNYSVRRI